MMDTLNKMLIPAFVGTSAMTLFSYLVTEFKKENFREPEVLGQLIDRLSETSSKDSTQLAGWTTHFAIGILFMAAYKELWEKEDEDPSFTSAALLGAASGLVGVIGWKSMFELHPTPPAKDLDSFFGHLILAHSVFGVFSALTYNQLK